MSPHNLQALAKLKPRQCLIYPKIFIFFLGTGNREIIPRNPEAILRSQEMIPGNHENIPRNQFVNDSQDPGNDSQ